MQLIPVTSASFTTPSAANITLLYNQALTNNYRVFAGSGAQNGDIIRIVRTVNGTGAYTVTFGGKSLTVASTFIVWQYDGSGWQEIEYGTLL
jgi:hypothetical protein